MSGSGGVENTALIRACKSLRKDREWNSQAGDFLAHAAALRNIGIGLFLPDRASTSSIANTKRERERDRESTLRVFEFMPSHNSGTTTKKDKTMSKKRPGVAASMRLAACTTGEDATSLLWERVEQQYETIRSSKLLEAEQACNKSLFPSNEENFHEISNQSQLLDIVSWKFAVGKPRPQLLGLIKSNTDKDIQRYTSEGIRLARRTGKDSSKNDVVDDGDSNTIIKDAINQISSNLQGVGPATASAILVRACPHKFCYMYDEVIDTFLSKRTYTLKVYVEINEECTRIANKLNKHTGGSEWTTARVARTLWIAARVLAAGGDGEDLTSKSKASAATAASFHDKKKRAAAAAATTTTTTATDEISSKKRRTAKSRKK